MTSCNAGNPASYRSPFRTARRAWPLLARPQPLQQRSDDMGHEAMNWLAGQLQGRQENRSRHHNPRPAGVVRPGSGTDALLRYLQRLPERWFFHCELVLELGRSKGEVDWALQYLLGRGMVQGRLTELPGRKPVMRYRLLCGCGQESANCQGCTDGASQV